MLTLILGGAKSGKTQYALDYALTIARQHQTALYMMATAPYDKNDVEMQQKIIAHQQQRAAYDDDIITIEEQINIAQHISDEKRVIMIDCLTLWLNNLIYHQCNITTSLDHIEQAIICHQQCNIVMISNELGMGIVPMDKETRDFREYHGQMNQSLAKIADKAYLIVAGMPITLKG